ncbi:MAG: esterase [Gammaproteobacteria bacterium]
MTDMPHRLRDILLNPIALLRMIREYFTPQRVEPVTDRAALMAFLNTRASFMAQTSLYGYLRTRAGMRYPELFDDDIFVTAINIAKWQIWLACLSDLAVYMGGLLMQHPQASTAQVSALMQGVVEEILQDTATPADAGEQFAEAAGQVRQRLLLCDWPTVSDDEGPFSHSPRALVQWAPIIDELKQLDEDIVVNSVRFRWQKVRQELRRALDAGAVLEVGA